jgi:hypothetical protein
MTKVTQQRLKEIFDYVDGSLVCKIPRSFLKIGDVAGHQRNDGYIDICVDKKIYFAHRLIFMFFNGYFPKEIDHINNIRNDNRIENLREVTHLQNQWNHSLKINNTSGFKGVSFVKKTGKWRAQINENSKKRYLGMFLTPEEAHQAYCKAAIAFRKEFARTN